MAAAINIPAYSDALVVLGSAGVVVPVLRYFGLSSVLGYLGAGALLVLILGEKVFPKRPIDLFVVAISIAVTTLLPLAGQGVKIVGAVPQGLPSLGWPLVQWNEVDNLLGVAFSQQCQAHHPPLGWIIHKSRSCLVPASPG